MGMKSKKPGPVKERVFNLAATYSRGGYTTTTIGKAAFDGRVRDGIGSVHSFMTTKKSLQTATISLAPGQRWVCLFKRTICSLKTTHRRTRANYFCYSRV